MRQWLRNPKQSIEVEDAQATFEDDKQHNIHNANNNMISYMFISIKLLILIMTRIFIPETSAWNHET